jgi:hypothetical protein
MQTDTWGPHLWVFLHCMSFNAPDIIPKEKQEQYKDFFTSLGQMLPCRYCRESYVYFLKKLPLDQYLGDRQGLTFWLYSLHNLVNYKLYIKDNKPLVIPQFYKIALKYESMKAGSPRPTAEIHAFATQAVAKYRPLTVRLVRQMLHELDHFQWDFSLLSSS